MKIYIDGYQPGIAFQDEKRYQIAKLIKKSLLIIDGLLTIIALVFAPPAIFGVLLFLLLGIVITKLETRTVRETVEIGDSVSTRVNAHDSEEELIEENNRKYRDGNGNK